MMNAKYRFLIGILVVLGAWMSIARAGDLAPPGPPAPTMHTLEEIYNRIESLETEVSVLQQQNARLDEQLGDLYAYEGLRGWEISVVVSDVSAGFSGVPLAFSPGGHPSICYQDHDQLMLATFDGAVWSVDLVDDSTLVSGFHSHAYHPGGDPAVAYQDGISLNLMYAIHDGSSWQHAVLDTSDNVGRYASLAFNSRRYAYIAYYDGAAGDLKLAYQTKIGGLIKWQTEAVVTNDDIGVYCQLVLDADDDPVISTVNSDRDDVALVRPNTSGGWLTQLLTSSRAGETTALAIRPDGTIGVLYKIIGTDEVTLQTVPMRGTFPIPIDGGAFEIAFAPDGQPAVALRDVNEHSLKFATLVGQHWSVERVGDIGLSATTLSLAFAPDGRPAISIYDGTRRQILYAIRAGDQ